MDIGQTSIAAFAEAVGNVGGQSAMSRLTGRTQQSISKRLAAKKPIWAEDVLLVEQATGISRHALRPDIYPVEVLAA